MRSTHTQNAATTVETSTEQLITQLVKDASRAVINHSGDEIIFGKHYQWLNSIAFLTEKRAQVISKINAEKTAGRTPPTFDPELIKQHKEIVALEKEYAEESKEPDSQDLSKIAEELIASQDIFESQCANLNISADDATTRIKLENQLHEIEDTLKKPTEFFVELHNKLLLEKKLENETADAFAKLLPTDRTTKTLEAINKLAIQFKNSEDKRKKLAAGDEHLSEIVDLQDKLLESLGNLLKTDDQDNIIQLLALLQKSQDAFVAAELKKAYDNEALPIDYIDWGTEVPVEQRYPGSCSHRDESGFAHFQSRYFEDRFGNSKITDDTILTAKPAGVLASCAPPRATQTTDKDATAKINAERQQRFLKMLFEKDVKHVLELGADSNIRLDYRDVTSGIFRSKFDKSKNTLTITNSETSEKRILGFTHFGVEDEQPILLSDNELNSMLEIFELYKKEVVLIHCDSGVGRTANAILIFRISDFLEQKQNTQYRKLVLELIDKIANKSAITNPQKTMRLMSYLFLEMKEMLFSLRRIRHSIQEKTQFISVLGQTILTIAIQEKKYTADQMNTLRRAFSFPEMVAAVPNITITPPNVSEKDAGVPPRAQTLSPEKGLLTAGSLFSQQTTRRDSLPPSTENNTVVQCPHPPIEKKPQSTAPR